MLIKGNSGALASVVSGNSGGAPTSGGVVVINKGGGAPALGERTCTVLVSIDEVYAPGTDVEVFLGQPSYDTLLGGFYPAQEGNPVRCGLTIGTPADDRYASCSAVLQSDNADPVTIPLDPVEIAEGESLYIYTLPEPPAGTMMFSCTLALVGD